MVYRNANACVGGGCCGVWWGSKYARCLKNALGAQTFRRPLLSAPLPLPACIPLNQKHGHFPAARLYQISESDFSSSLDYANRL